MTAMKKTSPQKTTTEMPRKVAGGCSVETAISKRQPQMSECASATESSTKQKMTRPAKTKIVAHIDCGFTNSLFIRGEGISSLSWDKGSQMKNIGPSEWLWETDRPFSTMQFKVLVNDQWYEQGDNHSVAFGQEIKFTPQF
jgi:hypothetical protein